MSTEGHESLSFPERAAERVADVALELVEEVRRAVQRRKPADVAVARYFAHHRELGARDRRFLSDLVFSYFRWRGWFSSEKGEDVPLACAVGYVLDAHEVPSVIPLLLRRASSSCTGTLCALGGRPLEERRRWVEQTLGRRCDWLSLVPLWVRSELFVPPNSADYVEQCLQAFQMRPPVWLYALRGARVEVQSLLRAVGIECQGHDRIPGAIRVPEQSPLRALPLDVRRRFIVQDLASQCVARVCAPRPGERWFDACAGAGGKTLHLADLMNDQGEVVATDIRPDMLRELYRRARETGYQSIRIGAGVGRADFDGVLVDAPCSGLGTWARNPDARWRTRKADVRWAERRQRQILESAAQRVRPGGVLIYSVCTLTTRETVKIVESFLAAHHDFQPDPFEHPLVGGVRPEAQAWGRPGDGPCGAMFIARFRRGGTSSSDVPSTL